MKKLKVLDLFSGIGGFSLGLERAGMETVAFCEIDEQCQKVLNKHWPDVPIIKDVSSLNKKTIEKIKNYAEGCWSSSHEMSAPPRFNKVDVICGGFPCQDISVAGKQRGFKDELGKRTRSGLWEEFKRVIKEIEPRYVIIENVANLRSKGLNKVLKDLWSLGYNSEWHIISARSIGACHLRERVWIIAYTNENRSSQRLPVSTSIKEEGLFPGGNGKKGEFTDPNMPRLWRPFTSEKASSRWWSESTSRFSDVFRKINEIKPTVCRGDDGIPDRLDKVDRNRLTPLRRTYERERKERVKQLGNSVVPQIPQLIGELILKYERLS